MPKDDYELVQHDQLDYLRNQVEQIKKNPFGDTSSSKDLLSSMDRLNRNIERMVAIFETASDEVVRDYKDGANSEKLNRVLDQNEKLAKGIVAIADLVTEMQKQQPMNAPPISQNNFPISSQPNPFIEPQPSKMQEPVSPQPEKLPPIDFSDVPPPPGK